MAYLIDSSVWLELLLEQERADEVQRFFDQITGDQIAITNFALHSISLMMTGRFRKPERLVDFLRDTILEGGVEVVEIPTDALVDVIEAIGRYKLDFDDAYQYTAAQRARYQLVSYDGDFAKTPLKSKTPARILAEIGTSEPAGEGKAPE